MTRSEFAEGLSSCGLSISDDRAAALIDKFDIAGDGRLACWEFIRMMASGGETGAEEEDGSPPQPPSPGLPQGSDDSKRGSLRLAVKDDETEEEQSKIEASLVPDETSILLSFKHALADEQRKLRRTFTSIAEGGKTVSAEQFKAGLKDLGCAIDDEAAERIVEKYDIEGSGQLKYYEFLRMMNDVA